MKTTLNIIIAILVAIHNRSERKKYFREPEDIKFHPHFHSNCRTLKGASPVRSSLDEQILETQERMNQTSVPWVHEVERQNLVLLNAQKFREMARKINQEVRQPLTQLQN